MKKKGGSFFISFFGLVLLTVFNASIVLADCAVGKYTNKNGEIVAVPTNYDCNGTKIYPLIVLLPGWFSSSVGSLS